MTRDGEREDGVDYGDKNLSGFLHADLKCYP
jgi:hypothetical protein